MSWDWDDLYGDARRKAIGPYDTAEICLNGHVTNSSVKKYPADSMKFCSQCGEATIRACPNCGVEIRGDSTDVITIYHVPSYCTECGSAYPWLKIRLDAAKELFELIDEFSDADRELLNSNLDDLVRETPRTRVASLKVKKTLSKAGSGIASAFREIVVDVLSETAKKTIWPNS